MMDIDAANGFIDFTTGSIDVVSGNITDTTVTLHSHTHNTTDPDPVGDNSAGANTESSSPTSNT